MKPKIQIKSIYGSIIFEFEKENNTIKDTVEEAVKQGANLYRANLYRANLYGANLDGASLNGASLNGASLDGASLNGASLDGANLDGASLDGASLVRASLNGASLDGASLVRASLNGASLDGASLPIYCKWPVVMVDEKIKIGCKLKSIEEWDEWFLSDEEYSTKRGTDDFKRIRANYEAMKAYLNIIKTETL